MDKWYLKKAADDTLFGPMGFDQLRQWAADAFIAPLDRVSNDGENWVRAPMIPELQMDYLLEISSGYYYGPTTVGAVREFLATAEITPETPVTNCKTGETRPLKEFPVFVPPQSEEFPTGNRISIKENLQQRIRTLEAALLEERRLRKLAEDHLAKAETRLKELEG